MARANRHFIPGHIWHLTHRCHKPEFLLKFSKVESQLKKGPERQEHFSGSIAVGSQSFIQKVLQSLGAKGIGRRMVEAPASGYQLKESMAKYGSSALDPAGAHQSTSSIVNTIPWKWEEPLEP